MDELCVKIYKYIHKTTITHGEINIIYTVKTMCYDGWMCYITTRTHFTRWLTEYNRTEHDIYFNLSIYIYTAHRCKQNIYT